MPKPVTLSKEDMKQALLKEQQDRQAKCNQEIAKVLKENNCTLDVEVVLRTNGVTPKIVVIAL